MLRTRLIAGRTSGLILSAVFASLMTLASQVEVVLEPLRVDPARPSLVTLRIPASYLPQALNRHRRGLPEPLVIRRGEVVNDPEIQRVVRAFERERRPPEQRTLMGVWISFFLIAYMFLAYLRLFTGGRGGLLRTQAGLLVLVGATWRILNRTAVIAALSCGISLSDSLSQMWLRRYEISAKSLSWRTMFSRTCMRLSGLTGCVR